MTLTSKKMCRCWVHSDLFVCVYQPSMHRARGATDRGETPKVRPPSPAHLSETLAHQPWNSPATLDGFGQQVDPCCAGPPHFGTVCQQLGDTPPTTPTPHADIRPAWNRLQGGATRDDVGQRTKKLDIFRKMWTAAMLKLRRHNNSVI